ncbi:hypothetical protein HETIRDRAFT_315835 [Heterobasidion irregulare TC 32-1]|uniref:Uncharacterized protein n=1 Tax=Heterobasidion irregulare (strain TC 32-1) TaxID=747525 RepID=W4KD39_HETIT|nr:uncharacterized protein HETIRDRAFT_315835 [Heterobasidion irregulare TC 32-1]ETW83240.1 hypothetical protein HETIRDRAFT_315835 [Heterobasidion irregulare TC 32-1]
MADITQTDVPRPSALPTANLRSRLAPSQPFVDQTSNEYLDNIEEEWNKKVDVEIETLADGMVDLVNLASIGDKDKFRIAQEAFQAQFRAESMVRTYPIRAANSLLSIIHSMKLLLLLSDEAQIVNRRDAEFKVTQREKEEAKKQVAGLLSELLRPPAAARSARSRDDTL